MRQKNTNFDLALSFIYSLNFQNIKIWAQEDLVKIKFPKICPSQEEIKKYIKINKDIILKILKENNINTQDYNCYKILKAHQSFPVLSFAQQRMWFLDQLLPDHALYNVPMGFRLRGKFNRGAFEAAIRYLVSRHETLRTRIGVYEGEGYQEIIEAKEFRLGYEDITNQSASDQELYIKEALEREAGYRFKLSDEWLFRAHIIRVSDDVNVLIMNMHHIITDGWSFEIFLKELNIAYEAYCKGEVPGLEPLEIQYGDFALWQRSWLQGEVLEKQLGYWKEALNGAPESIGLATDYERPKELSYEGGIYTREISESLLKKVKALSESEGATLFMTLLSVLNIVLYKNSGQEDMVIGSPIANRHYKEIEGLIGVFVNTLALRTQINSRMSFRELLRKVKETTVGAYSHQDIPFEQLVDHLNITRKTNQNPVFQVMFVLQNAGNNVIKLQDINIEELDVIFRQAKFDLSVFVHEADDKMFLGIKYLKDIFSRETIERIGEQFERVLEYVVVSPEDEVGSYEVMSEEERHRILVEWNETRVEYPKDKTVQDLFEEQVERSPESIAVVYGDMQLTYQELNERANQLAHYLRKKGVGRETLVGLSLNRSIEMVIGILGIIKAGGAYVPLDPEYPEERLQYMLEDTGAPVLITSEKLKEKFRGYKGDFVLLDDEDVRKELQNSLKENSVRVSGGNDLVYVIYTSGSTGLPKGVMIEHFSLMNLSLTQAKEFEINNSTRVLQFFSWSFDASVSEWSTALISGATLCIFSLDDRYNLDRISDSINKYEIEVLTLPPKLSMMIQGCYRIKTLIVAGEECGKEVKIKWSGHTKLINAYGPTESTVCATLIRVNNSKYKWNIPIGKPISNTSIYILDERKQPVPIGAIGEIYIGGAGLARGYLNRAELTAEKFVENPFVSEEERIRGENLRLYRTGDLGQYLADGNIKYVGRIDDQVKIRGYRIELGEIENALNSCIEVHGSVVVMQSGSNNGERNESRGSEDRKLVAYVVPEKTVRGQFVVQGKFKSSTGDEINILGGENYSSAVSGLKEALGRTLPEYMIPNGIVFIEKIPLTHNGKVDKKLLPAPDMDMLVAHQYVGPRNEVEKGLCEIWSEVLGLERVGIHDNFFEIGGHSLLATRVVSRIRAVYRIELPLKDLFTAPTVERLSQCVRGLQLEFGDKGNLSIPELRNIIRPERIPLSFAQQRMWFLEQLLPDHALYNVPMGFRLRGKFNRGAFEAAIRYLVSRHETLRTRIGVYEGEGYQEIIEAKEFRLGYEDITNQSASDQELYIKEALEREAGYRFKLSDEWLFRAHIIRVSDDVNVLIMNMHHIITDGWSFEIFLKELNIAYEAYCKGEVPGLEPLEIQYGDFALWQRSWLQGEVLEKQLGYWKEALNGAPESIGLATDYERPKELSYEGGIYTREISESLLKKVKALSESEGATLFMTLLSVLNIVLYKNSGQEDMVIGSPIANRHYKEIEGLIGVFVNTLALRTQINSRMSFRELLRKVKETTVGAYSHQDIPFEQLVDHLNITRKTNQNPVFQVMFVLQNAGNNVIKLQDINIEELDVIFRQAKFDLSVFVHEADDKMFLGIEYLKDIFSRETIERIGEQFERVLEYVVVSPEDEVGSYEVMSEEERHRILVEWNETRVEYPKDKTVQDLFEEQVERSPESIAVVYGDMQLTYQELNERANQLAHYLRKKGVGRETLVGLSLNRSIEMVIGILGIIKAGGAYVPLDPEYPEERLQYMLEDTGAPVLITSEKLKEKFRGYKGDFVLLDDEDVRKELQNSLKENSVRVSGGNDLVYVIYTSGSTGLPKGVMIEHCGVQNSTLARLRYYKNNPINFLLLSSISFDSSVAGIFWNFIIGGKVVLTQNFKTISIDQLASLIIRDKITHLLTTPSFYSHIFSILKGKKNIALKVVILAGELSSYLLIEEHKIYLPKVNLFNEYGPTEGTVWSTANCFFKQHKDIINPKNIGKPISNMSIYILDERRQPVPIGATGEIYIGGAGLARGYLNRAELTAEKFIANPFVSEEERIRGENLRLYRTGDLGQYLADGNIKYVGRIDDQVKIRGYRIELGEIENALNSCIEVHGSVVVMQSGSNNGERNESRGSEDRKLVAYVVPEKTVRGQFVVQGKFKSSTGDEINILGGENYSSAVSGLKEALGRTLPEYMIPNGIVFIEKIPLTHNGKVDKKLLPAPDMDMLVAHQYVGPRNEVEKGLCEIWSEVLGLERVGIHDNFFEIGGHSLLLVVLFTKLRKLFPLTRFSLIDLLENATVAKTAKLFSDNLSNASFIFPICQNDNNSKLPLFLIHPAGGLSLDYLGLKKYIYNRNVYGINNPFFGAENTFSTIEEMARYYTKEIQKTIPNGPYILGGYSFGGIIAYQIAYNLTSLGYKVPNVLLIDADYCTFSTNISFKEYVKDMSIELADLEDRNLKRQRETAVSLYYFYKPPTYDGQVTLIKTTIPPLEKKDYILEAQDNHWQKLLKKPLQIYTINARHPDLFNDKYISETAQIIIKSLLTM